ncbi:NTP transferase domain-containing protein [Sphingobium phenoxybenzoativorans]|uniref:NTP transferase domain-containing protein n=1 Tax=Sphingobium phenoxybenzoativorans TaxID=1592790 RepID=UPI0009F1BE8A|nr:NTP transferase domain-containing protein [Sphingobium phenoxybenzoativorans]
MSLKNVPATVIVLAAQRPGVVNELARDSGVSHKCLVPICGRPLIAHVIGTLVTTPGVGKIKVSVEPEIHLILAKLFEGMTDVPIELVPSRPGIADSVLAAAEGEDDPVIITTADNVLLTPAAIAEVRTALAEADVVAGMTTQGAVQAVHPEAQRRFYMFRDGGYSNCNLYGVSGPHAFRAAEIFREGGQFRKNPRRLVTAFGLFDILLVLARLVTLDGAMKRASRRFGLRFRTVIFSDGALAVDVDNARTYGIAGTVLAKRIGWAG